MSKIIKHAIATLLVLALTMTFYIQSLKYPPSAAKLPQILIVLISVLAVGMLIEAVLTERKAKKVAGEKPQKIHALRALVFGILIGLYIILIEPIGYFIVTPLFVIAAMSYLRAVNFLKAVLIAIGFTVFVYALFIMFLKIPIPMGLLS